MPKSTPRPTNSTANAIDSRLSEPTIIRPSAVVIARPMKRLTNTAKMIFAECSASHRMTSTTSDGADAVDDGAFLDGGEFLVGDRDRAGQPDPRADICRRNRDRRRPADRVGGVLAGLQRVVVEDRLELDEGARVGIGQRLVADEFAPGEGRVALVRARSRPSAAIRLNGRAVLSSLTWPRLTPASPVSSAPVRPRIEGSPAMISIRGAAESNWPVSLADLLRRQEQQPVLLEELAGAERLHRCEMLVVVRTASASSAALAAPVEFRRRRLHDRQDRAVAVERLVELVVALAPIQLGRNQRIDVGVDGEMPGRVDSPPRPQERARQRRRGRQTAYKP